MRQRAKDRAYIEACRKHGIEPDAPSYIGSGESCDEDKLDYLASDSNATHNGGALRQYNGEPKPLKKLPAKAEIAMRVIELMTPAVKDPKTFVRTAGRRCLSLAWLMGRRSESLADLARELGMSRASLSKHVRNLEDKVGLHGRGQKVRGAVETYRANAKRSWKLRRLNSMLKDAVESE